MIDPTEALTAYIDGELNETERAHVEAALAADPKLRALEQRLRRSVEALASLPNAELARPALRRSVMAQVATPSLADRVRAWLRPTVLLPISALAAAGIVGVVMLRPTREALPEFAVDEDALALAQNIDTLEDMDVAQVGDDLEVVAQLNELEATP